MILRYWFPILVLFILAKIPSTTVAFIEEYDLPIVPNHLHKTLEKKSSDRLSNGKFIPSLGWIAIRNASDEHPAHTSKFIARNRDWSISFCDNAAKDAFMNEYFRNTSLLWAYNIINPIIGTAKAELWRIAVLYVFGGVYMDDDADILVPLSQVVQSDDKFIVGKESYNWTDMCYRNEYKLSNYSFNQRYGLETNKIELFDNRFFLNWILFSSAGNPLLYRIMEHIVALIKYEYLSITMIKMSPTDHRGKLLMCASTFPITLAARELVLEGKQKEIGIRVVSEQFSEYQANMKAWNNDHNPNRWVKQMNKKRLPYLRDYAVPPIEGLEGRVIQIQNHRELYLVLNATKRSFPDFTTFVNMNFSLDLVQMFPAKMVNFIPVGPQLPAIPE